MAVFEMAHGIIPLTASTETLYEKEKMYKDKGMRSKIMESIVSRLELKENDIAVSYTHLTLPTIYSV